MVNQNDCYYFIAVYSFGVPMLVRGLTLKEATAMYEANRTVASITFLQYGVSGAPLPLGTVANL